MPLPPYIKVYGSLAVDESACIARGSCYLACPIGTNAIHIEDVAIIESGCITCGSCIGACPDGAITYTEELYNYYIF